MEKNKGQNIQTIKKENRKNILMLLKRNGAMSRKDIASHLGLTPAAVTIITSELLGEKILIEKGILENVDIKAGRKQILLDIDYSYKYVAGVSIDHDEISIGLCSLDGKVIDSISIKDFKPTSEEIFMDIAQKCTHLFWKSNKPKDTIIGIGVSIIGSVDEQEGISRNSYGIIDKKFNIKAYLENQLQIPVCVDNNVRTLAMAEMNLSNEKRPSNMIFVKYGPGIGSAVIINNEIYYGSNGNSGEIGHTIVDINGDLCRCGRRGCLETFASESAVIKKIKNIYSKENTPHLFNITQGKKENLTFDFIIDSACSGDSKIYEIVKDAALYIAMAIANTSSIYDPAKIIIYGKPFECAQFMKLFKSNLSSMMPSKDIDSFVELSNIKEHLNFTGGASLAIRHFFYNKGGQ